MKRVFTDKDKNELWRVVKENRRRAYKDITGVVNERTVIDFVSEP